MRPPPRLLPVDVAVPWPVLPVASIGHRRLAMCVNASHRMLPSADPSYNRVAWPCLWGVAQSSSINQEPRRQLPPSVASVSHRHHYGAATIDTIATRPLARAAKAAAKAVAKAVAKAGGGTAHNRPISAQLVSAALGVHLCCLSGTGCPLTRAVCATAAAALACRRGRTVAGVACGIHWAQATCGVR